MNRTVFHLTKDKERDLWVVKLEGDRDHIIDADNVKEILVRRTSIRCNTLEFLKVPCQMIVHLGNGEFEFERTYIADPPGSKG